tara:strand:+ start:155 stop:1006 length:852 start_codon:yes stop_codon:yes gene_type:complete
MSEKKLTIDCQVHSYLRNSEERPWLGFLQGPEEVSGDDMVKSMDSVGVDGAILVSPNSLYGYDPSYALEVYEAYPDRFALVKPFDPDSQNVADEIAVWAEIPGVVGARLFLRADTYDEDHPGLDRICVAVSDANIPLNVMCAGNLSMFRNLAARNPSTRFVLDHVGLIQPHVPPVPDNPFSDLENVISLASFDNVVIKISGACTLSHKQFPYPDIWEPLEKIFNAFGLERCMWGTDWTRAVDLLTYEQGVEAFRVTDSLSESEKSILMGESLTEIYGWKPSKQ